MYDDTRFSNRFVEVMVMLYQAKDAFFKAFNTELEEIGLNYAQAFVLTALRMSNRPLTVSEISYFLFRETHSTSELVRRMEECGYLEKTLSVDDKRCVSIRLTPKGIEYVDEVARRILSLCERLFSSLSYEQLEQFNRYLRIVRNQAVQEIGTGIIELPPHMSMHKLNEWLSMMQYL